MLMLAMLEMVLLIIEIVIASKIVDEYRFILEYRRDTRYFEDYRRKTKKQCMDIVEDVNNCEF